MNASSQPGASGRSSDGLNISPSSGEGIESIPSIHDAPEGPELAGAWRRFFARWIDIAVLGTAAGYAIGYLFPAFAVSVMQTYPGPSANLVFVMINLPLALILEAVEYGVFRDTLGKNLLGIRVVGAHQQKLGFGQYLKRNTDVWIRGFALGVPLISLFTMAHQAGRLRKGKQASWDERDGSSVIRYRKKWVSDLIATCGFLLLLAVVGWINSNSGNSSRDVLSHSVERLNTTLPKMIDHVTRLEDVRLGTGNVVIYDYTITNLSSTNADKHRANGVLRELLIKRLCVNRFVAAWINNGWSFDYRYDGNDRKLIAEVKLRKSDCRSK